MTDPRVYSICEEYGIEIIDGRAYARISGAHLLGASLREANLKRAYVDECDLRRADLVGADLRQAIWFNSQLHRARMEDADVKSIGGFNVKFEHVKGLAQSQLNTLRGDKGLTLPEGLVHPEHWEPWEPPNQDIDEVRDPSSVRVEDAPVEDRSFIFVSYSNQDRAKVATIKTMLALSGIPIWWDQDIQSGQGWREVISQRLDEAAAILTLWTENSVGSRSVVEEASRAQAAGKRVHARLDEAALPYGFGETQYSDLCRWDGTAYHPDFRNLTQALKDHLNPPSADELRERLISAAPMVAVVESGRITAKDSPPSAGPAEPDEADLSVRLQAQEVQAEKLIAALQTLDNNVGDAIRFDLQHYIDQLKSWPPSWYILNDSVSDLSRKSV